EPETVRELQAEGRHLIRKAELRCLREHLADVCGRRAWLDAGDSVVEPFARLLICVVLRGRRTHHVEGAVVASAITHEALQNVEECLVAGTDHAVGEIMRMRIAALSGNRIDRFYVV